MADRVPDGKDDLTNYLNNLKYSNHFKQFSGSKKRENVKAVLEIIEKEKNADINFEELNIEIEHIYPDSESVDNARLGNLILLEKELNLVMVDSQQELYIDISKKPFVILMVGVNGTGKTTTIGKLASQLKSRGLQVSMAAADTFRMAAVEQLQEWGKKVGCNVYASSIGADPAGTAYDAYNQAIKNKDDVLFIDTAGRLQNKKELMAELQKIVRVLKK